MCGGVFPHRQCSRHPLGAPQFSSMLPCLWSQLRVLPVTDTLPQESPCSGANHKLGPLYFWLALNPSSPDPILNFYYPLIYSAHRTQEGTLLFPICYRGYVKAYKWAARWRDESGEGRKGPETGLLSHGVGLCHSPGAWMSPYCPLRSSCHKWGFLWKIQPPAPLPSLDGQGKGRRLTH